MSITAPFAAARSLFGSVVNMLGAVLDRSYAEVRAALHAARAAVFSLDVTDADYHTFEVGLQTVAVETGGFFARTHLFARQAIDRVANALVGHDVLLAERPAVEPALTASRASRCERRAPCSHGVAMSSDPVSRPPGARPHFARETRK